MLGLSGCGSHVYHQVRTGDTLYSISWRYSQSYESVAKWNGIPPPYIVKQGQWLRVAPPASKAFSSAVESDGSPLILSNNKEFVSPTVRMDEQKPSAGSGVALLNSAVKSSVSPRFDDLVWQWPMVGDITKPFNSKAVGKSGVAIKGHLGDVVRAAASGKVVYSGNSLKGYGNLVIIKHNDKYLSAYGNHQNNLVSEGDVIKVGQAIGKLGRSESGVVQLYFEIRIDGKPSNPLGYLPKRRS